MADKSSSKSASSSVADTSKQMVDRARETVSSVAEGSKAAMDSTSKGASAAAGYLEEQAENATYAVAGGLQATAQTIRENVPEEGPMKGAAYGVAQRFSNAANYLDEQGLEGLKNDLSAFIRNSPLAAMAVGVGLGYMLGLTLRLRS